ncbi:MAG TPA: hypothetical protein PLZ51_18960, partial [Aggregatilineales bacterium]|nr:hypothetical protein [Aggregatilineales bacterium]
ASRVRAILQRSNSKKQSGSSRGATIGVLGVKGGIGATTITMNLGASLLNMKATPVIADFRLGAGSLGSSLGLGQNNGMSKLLSRPANEITADTIIKELATHQSGLRVLSCSTKPREGLLNPSPDTAVAIVNELRSIGKPTIFDLGAGFNPLVNRLQAEMDRLLILVDPATVTLSMARELLQELAKN